MNYYQHNIGDYRRDTMHLSLLEHGIYRQLLDLYYLNECELNANALRLICARNADEMRAAENILNEFFFPTENGWGHKRCDEEIARYKAKSEKAKASAGARWSERNANALKTQCEGNANHKPLTNNQYIEKKNNKKKIPADLKPNDLHVQFCVNHGMDVQEEFDQFVAHHSAKGSSFVDWNAAFRTWLGNAAKWASEKKSSKAKSSSDETPWTRDCE